MTSTKTRAHWIFLRRRRRRKNGERERRQSGKRLANERKRARQNWTRSARLVCIP
jgi:hypothetical protein